MVIVIIMTLPNLFAFNMLTCRISTAHLMGNINEYFTYIALIQC